MGMNKGKQQVWFDIPSIDLYLKEESSTTNFLPLLWPVPIHRGEGIVNQEGRRIDKG
jgi:hypothetical protein